MAKYSMKHSVLFAFFVLTSCTSDAQNLEVVKTAIPYIGHSESHHRKELKDLLDVDPVHTQWCAAFVNSVLEVNNIPGSESVSEHPLMARSFLRWGEKVSEPKRGDIIVFPRGNSDWQGHVGFYISTYSVTGIEYYVILGGNQDDKVSYELYPSARALSIRRPLTQ